MKTSQALANVFAALGIVVLSLILLGMILIGVEKYDRHRQQQTELEVRRALRVLENFETEAEYVKRKYFNEE